MTSTLIQRVFLYIEDHPGTTRKEIRRAVAQEHTPLTVTRCLQVLRVSGVIENRGGRNSGARWYAVDMEAKAIYFHLADKLLDELKNVHPTLRKAYLAKRLEELIET